MVAMADLRNLLGVLGFEAAKSILQSGNLTFHCHGLTAAALERLLEVETARRLNVAPDYVVRTASEWNAVIASNPFAAQAKIDPSHLLVMFLKQAPQPKEVKELQAAIQGPELVRAIGKQLYIVYPAGIGRSKLTGTRIEQKLGTRGTGRNWNTILKLATLLH
jgi:uncharacterized protein (DUF1697 family)